MITVYVSGGDRIAFTNIQDDIRKALVDVANVKDVFMLIYVCLTLALGSLSAPLVVIFAIPFGFTGVVFAFGLHGLPLSTIAVVGIAGLAGVVVNDSLVMASTISQSYTKDPNAGMRAAVLHGAGLRFRAVVLTSLTTMAGVFPMAYGIFGETGWIRPMVLAVGWGLLFATVLTLFVLPSLLLIMNDIKRLVRWPLDMFKAYRARTRM